MRKIFQNLSLLFCCAAILLGCGRGLCPIKGCPVGGAYTALGIIDNSFGTAGYVTKDFAGGSDIAYAVGEQSGKIIVAGTATYATTDATFLRINSNGILDTTFGTTGVTHLDNAGLVDGVYAAIVQSDGKIVAAGATGGGADSLVVRLNSDGSADTTFGSTGLVITDVAAGIDYSYSIGILNNGSYLATGQSVFAGNDGMGLINIKTTGALETTFGPTGVQWTGIGGQTTYGGQFLRSYSDNSMLVSARWAMVPYKFRMYKYIANGSFDTSFGTSGIAEVNMPVGWAQYNFPSTIQTDGKPLYTDRVTTVGTSVGVARLTANGASLDTTFASVGYALLSWGDTYNEPKGIFYQPNGKILVTAEITVGNHGVGVARLNSDGTIDTSFGVNGYFSATPASLGATTVTPNAIMLQSDGTIIVAGNATIAGNVDFIVLKIK